MVTLQLLKEKVEVGGVGSKQQCVSSCTSSVPQLGLSWRCGSGQGFHAATMVKCLWYAWPAPHRQHKSRGWAQKKKKKGKKAPNETLKSCEVLFLLCVCVCVSHACSKSATCYDHTLCDVCVFSILSVRQVEHEIRVSLSLCLVSTDSSSVCHHLSIPRNLRCSITLPVTDLAFTHFTPPPPSVSLPPACPCHSFCIYHSFSASLLLSDTASHLLFLRDSFV